MFEQNEGWWTGWVEELPGANVQERTLDEARQSLQEVIPLILASRCERDQTEPASVRLREELTVTV